MPSPSSCACLATSCCRVPSKFRGGETVVTRVPQCSLLRRALGTSSVTHKWDECNKMANLRCILNHPSLLNGLQLAQLGTRSSVLPNGSISNRMLYRSLLAAPGACGCAVTGAGTGQLGGSQDGEGRNFPGRWWDATAPFRLVALWAVHPFWHNARYVI